MSEPKYPPLSGEELQVAIAKESERFKATYLWLEKHLPSSFLNEVDPETRIVIARNLLSFSLQGKWIQIRLKAFAVVCCIDGPAADLQILKPFENLRSAITERLSRMNPSLVRREI